MNFISLFSLPVSFYTNALEVPISEALQMFPTSVLLPKKKKKKSQEHSAVQQCKGKTR